MAEGNRSETIPGEVPREGLCSAHRGTEVRVLTLHQEKPTCLAKLLYAKTRLTRFL